MRMFDDYNSDIKLGDFYIPVLACGIIMLTFWLLGASALIFGCSFMNIVIPTFLENNNRMIDTIFYPLLLGASIVIIALLLYWTLVQIREIKIYKFKR